MPPKMSPKLAALVVKPAPPGFAKHLAGQKGMDEPEGIKPPEGFDLQGKGPGDMVQVVMEMKVGEGGMLIPMKMNGIPMDGAEEPKEGGEEEEPDRGMTDTMPGQVEDQEGM